MIIAALQRDWGLRFHQTDNPHLLAYSKRSEDGQDLLIVVVNLDPFYMQHGFVQLPLAEWGFAADDPDRSRRPALGGAVFLAGETELRAARSSTARRAHPDRAAACAARRRAARTGRADDGRNPRQPAIPLWYKDAVIYQAHVRAFFDSTNDGIGDFAGLTQKLPYLESLGVNCIWLLPFYPSPLRDDGYDIADYTNIHPSYGTLADFDRFIEEAHGRGLRVITELVINHTSDQHPWFQAARRAPAGSPERDFYVWSETNRKYEGVRIIFTDTETSNWSWDDTAKAYYWHRFFHHQPDLNFDNPAVLDAVIEVMRFWLDRGVDGLRLDAVPYLIEREGHHLREPRRDPRRPQADPRRARRCAIPTACCSRKPTSGRPTSARISATATSATWRSTFR